VLLNFLDCDHTKNKQNMCIAKSGAVQLIIRNHLTKNIDN